MLRKQRKRGRINIGMTSQLQDIAQLQGYIEFVEDTAHDWHIPGLGMAILRRGHESVSTAFGHRDVEGGRLVTPMTLFPIGSCSKAFTTAAIAMLVDEGRLEWDRPVCDYLPAFQLRDQFASQRMSVRDLLTHQSGLPRHDLVWLKSGKNRQSFVEGLRYLEPSRDFRSSFQYQNLMYIAAGHIVDQVTRSSWEELVCRCVFQALGMTASTVSFAEFEQNSNVAFPYRRKEETTRRMPFLDTGSTGPAGGVYSNALDMARWIEMHLGVGKVRGRELVSVENISETHSPQVVVRDVEGLTDLCEYPELGYLSYGMGWFMQSYRGHCLLWHGGNLEGFSSWCSVMPDEGLGVVVLTNMHDNPVGRILAFNAYDRLLGLNEIDWSGRLGERERKLKAKARREKENILKERVEGTHRSRVLEEYVGEYYHPAYGSFSVTCQGDSLRVLFHSMSFRLEHYHYDVFLLDFDRWDVLMRAIFTSDVRGRISSVAVLMEPAVEPIVFERRGTSGCDHVALGRGAGQPKAPS